MAGIRSNLDKTAPHPIADFVTIPEACIAVSCTTAKIARLLISGQLPGSQITEPNSGFDGLRINIPELKSKLLVHATTGLSMPDLRKQLGLQYLEVKKLTLLKLLPSYSGRNEISSRPAFIIDLSDLAKFLDRFQTIRTVALRLKLDEEKARSKILKSGIHRASEGERLPIYRTGDIAILLGRQTRQFHWTECTAVGGFFCARQKPSCGLGRTKSRF